jgi:heat shock protein 5
MMVADQAKMKQQPYKQIPFDVFALRYEDKEVQRDIKLLPYKIVNKDGKPYIQVKIRDDEIKVFSPEEISAMILLKMKETVES